MRIRLHSRLADAVFATAIRAEWAQSSIRSALKSDFNTPLDRMPRLLVLPNVRGWAFDQLSQERARYMQSTWHTDLQYVKENPVIDQGRYDLMFNPNWGYSSYDAMFHGRYVRGINSHKWQRSRFPYRQLRQYLRGAIACIVPNLVQYNLIRRVFPATFLVKEGVDTAVFRWLYDRTGNDLVVGWSGNQANRMKRLETVIIPSCRQAGVELRIADVPTREDLNRFYNDVDLVLIASEPLYEGNPLSLFEAGACGRAVLATNVGCVPEIVEDKITGLVVESSFDVGRTVKAFVEKLRWCKENIVEVRVMGKRYRERVLAERNLERTCETFRQVIEWAYGHVVSDRHN